MVNCFWNENPLRGRSPKVITAWKTILKWNDSIYSNINWIGLHCFRSIDWRRWYRIVFSFYWMPLKRIRPTMLRQHVERRRSIYLQIYSNGDCVRSLCGMGAHFSSRVECLFSPIAICILTGHRTRAVSERAVRSLFCDSLLAQIPINWTKLFSKCNIKWTGQQQSFAEKFTFCVD